MYNVSEYTVWVCVYVYVCVRMSVYVSVSVCARALLTLLILSYRLQMFSLRKS